MTPEAQAKIAIFRHKAAEGSLTPDEMREAVLLMRENRVAAATTASVARKKAIKAVPSADDLLSELGDL